MSLSRAHQKKVLNAAVTAVTWPNQRRTLRTIFDAIDRDEGCSVRGYKNILEKTIKAVTRAIAALDILEAND